MIEKSKSSHMYINNEGLFLSRYFNVKNNPSN